MKVELHLLQSFPPSNLNRDDTGAPKDCQFGGHRRARISSQAIKRAIRHHDAFKDSLSHTIADRTKRVGTEIERRLVEDHGRDAELARTIADALAHAATQKKFGAEKTAVDEEMRTEVLFFVSPPEVEALAAAADAAWDGLAPLAEARVEAGRALAEAEEDAKGKAEKEVVKAQQTLKKDLAPLVKDFIKEHEAHAGSADLALFGRMLASHPALNLDAACQVAHAISVDAVAPQFDYYTAADDLKKPAEEDKGAEMIGTTGFTSACFYRYHVVDVDQLARNLGTPDAPDDALAREAVRAFLAAAVAAIPSGKQNAFAAQTPPLLVFAVLRERGMPVSLVNAFEVPVRPAGRGVAETAVQRLAAHWATMQQMYEGLLPNAGSARVFVCTPFENALSTGDGSLAGSAPGGARYPSVRDLLDAVDEALASHQTARA